VAVAEGMFITAHVAKRNAPAVAFAGRNLTIMAVILIAAFAFGKGSAQWIQHCTPTHFGQHVTTQQPPTFRVNCGHAGFVGPSFGKMRAAP